MTSSGTKKQVSVSIRKKCMIGVAGIAIAVVVLIGCVFTQLNFPYYTHEKLAGFQAGLGLHAAAKNESVKIIGHRGSGLPNVKAISPQEGRLNPVGNSRAGIRSAIDAGVDWVEIDLRRSKDGTLVLFHDESVDRITDGEGRISEWTAERLQNLTLSSDGETGEKILTLEDFEEGFLQELIDRKVGLILDIKQAGLKQSVLDWVNRAGKEYGLESNRVVVFGEFSILKEFSDGEMRLGYTLTWKKKGNRFLYLFRKDTIIQRLVEIEAEILVVPVAFTSKSLVLKTEKRGIKTWTYGTDDERDWGRISGLGVQGLIVDYPTRAIEYFYPSADKGESVE